MPQEQDSGRVNAFAFKLLGNGSLFEQAVVYVVNTSTLTPLDSCWLATASDRLNRLIDEELAKFGAFYMVGEQKFKFEFDAQTHLIRVCDGKTDVTLMSWYN
jgi:hypothetical protein